MDPPGAVTLGDDGLPGLVESPDLNPTSDCDTVGEVEGRLIRAINIIAGTIKVLHVQKGDSVNPDESLIEIE